MTATDLPAWATDPLPVAVLDRHLDVWAPDDKGEYSCTFGYEYLAPAALEAQWGPCVPLRPETPPMPIDPADIKVGMRVRRVWERDGLTLSAEGLVSSSEPGLIFLSGYDYLAKLGGWFLIPDAPDPDAEVPETDRPTVTWTPPTSPLHDLRRWHQVPEGATIPAGTPYVTRWGRDNYGMNPPAQYDLKQLPGVEYQRFTEHLIPAPDPDAHWIRAIAEATPETAATVLAMIRSTQTTPTSNGSKETDHD